MVAKLVATRGESQLGQEPLSGWQQHPELRRALAVRDISAVYRLMVKSGVPQRQIAEMTGMGASEVSEVLAGRQVQGVQVLERIADGLGVPRGWLGLQHDPPVTPETEEVSEDVKRRAFLAAASMALWSRPVLGELLEIPQRPETPAALPSRLGTADVEALQSLTEQIRSLAREHGGYASMITPVASRAELMLGIPSSEATKRDLHSIIAELHIVAGWAAHDAALSNVSRHHFDRAIAIGGAAGNYYKVANTLVHSAIAAEEQGHPADAVKMYQLSQVNLTNAGQRNALDGWLQALTASAYASMGRPEARRELSTVRDEWVPPNGFEAAMMDWRIGDTYLRLGDLERAQEHAAASVRGWQGSGERRDAVLADVLLASVHLKAGERNSPAMAVKAVDSVADLRSERARRYVAPLAAAR